MPTTIRTSRPLAIVLAVVALAAAACGGASGTPTETDGAIGSVEPGDGADRGGGPIDGSPAPTGPVTSIDGVEPAVAFILATGSYVDPFDGERSGSWTGTGFFIDGQGTLVTNNHVATGAAFLEVFVNGESEPRTASILGQDECSDLAVLRVEGEGFASLDYHTDPFDVGLPVYAAGFPLSDPEYTLTAGIIAKRDADGATNWTSVEEVVQHDARINPGNSGGPLVSEAGRVVGINYAGNASTDQNFAITAIDAIPIIEHLASGQDRESLGINGQAILLEDGTNGVFVQSIETGAAADRLGIQAGDFILAIEDVPAAPDGTMSGYCKILRSQGSDQPLKVDVFRPSTGETLRGTINTGEKLEVVATSAATGSGSSGSSSSGSAASGTDGSTVVDHAGAQLRIPATMVGWEIRTISIAGRELLVSVADDEARRSTGLRGVPSPFDLDGVLFAFPSAADLSFWTFRNQFDIDLAFFGEDGSLVTAYQAAPPCPAEPCLNYVASASRFAVTTPAGRLSGLGDDATLVLG